MEKIQNFVENNIGSSKRFENLNEELLDYQFQYIDKIEDRTITPLYEKDEDYEETFKDYLYGYTNIRPYLSDEYYKIIGDKMYSSEGERKKFDEWFDSVFNQVKLSHDEDKKSYHDKAFKIFKDEIDKLSKLVNNKEKYNKKEIDQKIGLIHFNQTEAMNEYTKFGINEGDDCISIHFKDLIKQKNEDNTINNIFSGDSLSKLAVEIVNKYPQTKAILVQSWIVGSPIGKRIGFTETKKINDVVQDTRFWGQFINDKGQINKERMQKFLNTGIPDYYITDGFIKTEDFLKKYLPNKNRGIIKLKDLSSKAKKFREDINKISRETKEKWETCSFEELFSIINRNPIMADFYKTEDGQRHREMCKSMKESGFKSADDFDYKNKEEIIDKYLKYLEKFEDNYIEREVFIP
jgi:hypothetical protein